jgi:hypothetical protein
MLLSLGALFRGRALSFAVRASVFADRASRIGRTACFDAILENRFLQTNRKQSSTHPSKFFSIRWGGTLRRFRSSAPAATGKPTQAVYMRVCPMDRSVRVVRLYAIANANGTCWPRAASRVLASHCFDMDF